MMLQRTGNKFIIYFFLIIILGSINNYSLTKFINFKINHIYITGFEIDETLDLRNNIFNLNLKNIFFLNKKLLLEELNKNNLIENFYVHKNYPSTLKLVIKKTKFVAKIKKQNDIFLVGTNAKLVPLNNLNLELPFIFGEPKISEILHFLKIIENSNLKIEEVDSLYYFRTGRWDIKTKNNKIIKLPINDYLEKLQYLPLITINKNFDQKILDYRIQNQIITYD